MDQAIATRAIFKTKVDCRALNLSHCRAFVETTLQGRFHVDDELVADLVYNMIEEASRRDIVPKPLQAADIANSVTGFLGDESTTLAFLEALWQFLIDPTPPPAPPPTAIRSIPLPSQPSRPLKRKPDHRKQENYRHPSKCARREVQTKKVPVGEYRKQDYRHPSTCTPRDVPPPAAHRVKTTVQERAVEPDQQEKIHNMEDQKHNKETKKHKKETKKHKKEKKKHKKKKEGKAHKKKHKRADLARSDAESNASEDDVTKSEAYAQAMASVSAARAIVAQGSRRT